MIAAQALLGIAEVGLLLLLIYGPWQAYCTADARQNMFILRARLFDIAWSGKIGFDDEAYRLSRMQIERLIRFAHRLSLPRVLVLLPAMRQVKHENHVRSVVAAYPNLEVREQIETVLDDVSRELLRMLVRKSVVLLFCATLLLVPLKFFSRATGVARALTAGRRRTEQFATRRLLPAIWQEADCLQV